jgi:hypothetical protein
MGEMDSFITDKHFIMHVRNNLNKDYDNTVKNLEKMINDRNDPLTIEQMREDLCLKHERLYGTDNAGEFESDDDGEHALYAGAGKWKGKCNKCGKQGHKAVDCRSNGVRANKDKARKGGKRFDKSATTVKRLVTVLATASRRRESKAVNRQTLRRTRTWEKKKRLPM